MDVGQFSQYWQCVPRSVNWHMAWSCCVAREKLSSFLIWFFKPLSALWCTGPSWWFVQVPWKPEDNPFPVTKDNTHHFIHWKFCLELFQWGIYMSLLGGLLFWFWLIVVTLHLTNNSDAVQETFTFSLVLDQQVFSVRYSFCSCVSIGGMIQTWWYFNLATSSNALKPIFSPIRSSQVVLYQFT